MLFFASAAIPLIIFNAQNFRAPTADIAREEIRDEDNITHRPIEAKIEVEERSYKPFNATAPCGYIDDPLVDLPMPKDINHAFSMVLTRNKPIPRAYLMGLETFFKNNPNMTLYVYGDVAEIDPRFVEGGYKLVLVHLNLTDLMEKLVAEIPDMTSVFTHQTWEPIVLFMKSKIMVMADFVRLSLLYLHGGTWFDADSLVLRPFTWRNALPCFQDAWVKDQLVVLCTPERTVKNIYFKTETERDFILPENSLNCANTILGGFAKKHPFIRRALLGMQHAWETVPPPLKPNVFGTHLLIETLIATNNNNSFEVPNRLSLFEWPNIYSASRMMGDEWDPSHQLEIHNGSVFAVLADLEQRKVWTMHIYSWNSGEGKKSNMRKLFARQTFMWHLWHRNCIFSCNEPLFS